jgi:hypothetical protein
MPLQYNLGRDTTLTINTSAGPLRPTILTNFSSKQETSDLKSMPLNGEPIHNTIPQGWSGSFEFDRASSAVDDYFTRQEDGYYAGLAPDQVTITETIKEVAGGVSQYQYTGVSMKLDDTGSRKSDDRQVQKVSFRASRRRKVL